MNYPSGGNARSGITECLTFECGLRKRARVPCLMVGVLEVTIPVPNRAETKAKRLEVKEGNCSELPAACDPRGPCRQAQTALRLPES